MLRRIALGAALLIALALGVVLAAGEGWFGEPEDPGVVHGVPRSVARMQAESSAQRATASALGADATGQGLPRGVGADATKHDLLRDVGAEPAKQILFGDLHVHTTFSFDAFLLSMPALVGEGAHPPADACDFARYCSALDFWSINDHAEGLTADNWRDSISSIRQCNAVAGAGKDPDTVAFLGWEWTQVGTTPENHFGHKNVLLRGTEDDQIPARPIAAGGRALQLRQSAAPGALARGLAAIGGGSPRYHDLARYFAVRADDARCPDGIPERELPRDCLEVAETPASLLAKLDDWGVDSIVIPHGTTWGFYTPPGSRWDKQLAGPMHDEDRQTLIEVFSGHGDSEQYRAWQEVSFGADGKPTCPAARPDYLPTCVRAGEIIRERCLAAGEGAAECDARAARTRQLAAEAGGQAHLVVDGARAAEWLDAGQCRDCDQPAFNYRPGGAVQYILALGNFASDPAHPRRFHFGFIGSSDNHFARAGTGFKQLHRRGNTESNGEPLTGVLSRALAGERRPPSAEPRPYDPADTSLRGFQLAETERQTSFFMAGGLAAVHAEGRDRNAIWDALARREVYGTTGQRTLLWFDLLNAPGGAAAPMGSEVAMGEAPRFRVRAAGSLAQKPGCPEDAVSALGADGIERLCKGECHNPADQRRAITRIEIVRIRPQRAPGEPIAQAIDDPFLVLPCEASPAGCSVELSDPEFPRLERDALYYARAYEAPELAINAGGVRCERDASGECKKVHLCPGPDGAADDCLAEREPRAWSSPIYLSFSPQAPEPAHQVAAAMPEP